MAQKWPKKMNQMSRKTNGNKCGMYKALFVCTGNTCRSPMAEAFFNLIARENGLPMRGISAGLSVSADEVSKYAIKTAAKYGVDLSNHRPRPLTPDLIDEVNLILAMTSRHKREIDERFPSAQAKSWTLLSFIGERGDIDDPFGGSLEEYRECAQRLWEAVNRVIAHLAPEGEDDYAG